MSFFACNRKAKNLGALQSIYSQRNKYETQQFPKSVFVLEEQFLGLKTKPLDMDASEHNLATGGTFPQPPREGVRFLSAL